MTIGEFTYGVKNITVVWDIPAWCNKENKKIEPQLIIGKFCSIGGNLKVYLGGNHRSDWITTYPFHVGVVHNSTFDKFKNIKGEYPQTNGNVVIGNDVWIGDNVTIMSGVHIGDGAIIAANSLIITRVKPYSVVGGNPAQFYYYRFPEDVREKLLKLKWWNLDNNTINEISPILCSGDYNKLFEILKV